MREQVLGGASHRLRFGNHLRRIALLAHLQLDRLLVFSDHVDGKPEGRDDEVNVCAIGLDGFKMA